MNMLGIILVASPFDWLFAKGAIASCKHFMPSIPIQLIVDGRVDTRDAEHFFGISVVRASDIEHRELRRLGFGWGTTKLLAFWKSQTETFLYLDSDAVLWGDLTDKLEMQELDYLASIQKSNAYTEGEIENWFFNIPFVEKHFPDWDWKVASESFFCPGVFAGRKNAFQLEEYLMILRLNKRNPGQFKFGDMGFHNLMVFRGRDLGTLRVGARNFQVIFPEHKKESLEERFAFDSLGQPRVRSGDEQVLHMPDQKPLVDNENCYSVPMTFFRLKYLEITKGIHGQEAMGALRAEDREYYNLRQRFLRKERNAKLLRLMFGHSGEWRRALGRILFR